MEHSCIRRGRRECAPTTTVSLSGAVAWPTPRALNGAGFDAVHNARLGGERLRSGANRAQRGGDPSGQPRLSEDSSSRGGDHGHVPVAAAILGGCGWPPTHDRTVKIFGLFGARRRNTGVRRRHTNTNTRGYDLMIVLFVIDAVYRIVAERLARDGEEIFPPRRGVSRTGCHYCLSAFRRMA